MKRLIFITPLLICLLFSISAAAASTSDAAADASTATSAAASTADSSTATTPKPEELKENEFILDGTFYSGHIKMADLLDDDWKLDPKDEGKEYEPRTSENAINSWSVPMTKGDLKIDVSPYNLSTKEPCTIEETEILMIRVEESSGVPFYIENGLSFDATAETIKEIYGDDIELDERKGFVYYDVPKMNVRVSFVVEGDDVTAIKLRIPR